MTHPKADTRKRTWIDVVVTLLLVASSVAMYRQIALTNLILSGVDAMTYFYPYRAYAAQVIGSGQIPLWNPYLFLGVPFLANPQSGVFYPLNLALSWLSAPKLVAWSIVIHTAIAAVTATLYARRVLRLSSLAAFLGASAFALGGYGQLPYYLVLGLLVGLVAVLYVRTLYNVEDLFERVRLPGWLKPAVGGLLLGGLLVWFPQVYGVGYSTMVQALDGHLAWQLMAALIVVKLVAVNITLGSGFSGGIFAPALFLGGMVGGTFGAVLQMAFPDNPVPVGAFAMVGMAAMVGAATGGPLTAILILFEMTSRYQVILPLMLASIGAALIYRSVMGDSIFTLKFTRLGKKLHIGRESAILRNFHVQDIMEVNPVSIPASYGLDKILKLFLHLVCRKYVLYRLAGTIHAAIQTNLDCSYSCCYTKYQVQNRASTTRDRATRS